MNDRVNVSKARAALAGAWAVLVAASLWTAGPEAPPAWTWLAAFEEAGGDKLVHAALFAVQAWLLCRSRPGAPGVGWLLGCLAAAVAYGALTEGVQLSLAGREGDLLDLAADALGAGLGTAAYATERRWRGRARSVG